MAKKQKNNGKRHKTNNSEILNKKAIASDDENDVQYTDTENINNKSNQIKNCKDFDSSSDSSDSSGDEELYKKEFGQKPNLSQSNAIENVSDSDPDDILDNDSKIKICEKNKVYLQKNLNSFKEGLAEYKKGNYDNAIELYKITLNTDEHNRTKALCNLALIYDELNDIDNADHYYKLACKNNYQQSCHNYSLFLMEQKRPKEALQYICKLIRSGDFAATELYIECLTNLNKHNEAFDLLEKYIKYNKKTKDIKLLFTKCVQLHGV